MNENFREAAKDYFYLTERGYPQRGFLQLVGNRYDLSNAERSMLYRGIVSEPTAHRRQLKTIGQLDADIHLHIDYLNVVTTISSYLLGLPVFISLDGFLRDASLKRGRLEENPKLSEAAGILSGYLSNHEYCRVTFYIDKAGEITEQAVKNISALSESGLCSPEINIVKDADKPLIAVCDGVVCTSDSGIIDNARCRIFDFAHSALQQAFQPTFFDLKAFIRPT